MHAVNLMTTRAADHFEATAETCANAGNIPEAIAIEQPFLRCHHRPQCRQLDEPNRQLRLTEELYGFAFEEFKRLTHTTRGVRLVAHAHYSNLVIAHLQSDACRVLRPQD
jgi:hypothetical protein